MPPKKSDKKDNKKEQPKKKGVLDESVVSGRAKRAEENKGKPLEVSRVITSGLRSIEKGVFELFAQKGDAHDWKSAAVTLKEKSNVEKVDLTDPLTVKRLQVQGLMNVAGDMKEALKTYHKQSLIHMDIILSTDNEFLKWLIKLTTPEEEAELEKKKRTRKIIKRQRKSTTRKRRIHRRRDQCRNGC